MINVVCLINVPACHFALKKPQIKIRRESYGDREVARCVHSRGAVPDSETLLSLQKFDEGNQGQF